MAFWGLHTLLCSALLWACFSTAEAYTDPGDGNVACRCADEGKPACALAGVVFPSACQLMCAGAQLRGLCGVADATQCASACKRAASLPLGGAPLGVACPALSQPVCTKLGAVLDSPCVAQALQAEIRYNCTGKGYGNEQCVRECFTAVVKDVVAEPSPVPAPPAGCACNTTQAPVCSKGGRVYGNPCLLECAQEELNYPCTAAALGMEGAGGQLPGGFVDDAACAVQCKADALLPSCDDRCAGQPAAPVCAANGSVYDSACQAACRRAMSKFSCGELGLDGGGCAGACSCMADCARRATLVADPPVCGASGRLWMSSCELECAGDEQCDPSVYSPVCAADGRVIPSTCQAECDGVEMNAAVLCSSDPAGQAECQQRCQAAAEESRCRWCNSTEWAPLCALDGSVVPNACLAKCKGIPVNWALSCPQDRRAADQCAQLCSTGVQPDPCATCDPGLWAPLCALDGSVVPNACIAKCKNITVNPTLQCPQGTDQAGACARVCAGAGADCGCDPEEYAPVCAADGSVVRSACVARCKGLDVDWSLACPQDRASQQQCAAICAGGGPPDECGCNPNVYTPVCGRDGIVWDSECQAKCMGTEANRDITCDPRQGIMPCMQACAEAAGWTSPGWDCGKCAGEPDAPACTAEGMVLQNKCLVQCNGLTFSYECGGRQDCAGDCYRDAGLGGSGESDCSVCDREPDPVCASNGRVFDNECLATCQGSWMSVLFSCSDPDASGQVPADCAQRCQQALPQVQPLLPPGCAKCQSVKSVVEVCGRSGVVQQHPCLLRCQGDDVRFECGSRTNCAADCLAAKQAEDSLPRGCKCVDISAPVCAASGLVLPNQCTSLCSGYEPWFECGALSGRQCSAACRAAYQQYLQDTRPADVAAGARMADSCRCSGARRSVCAASGTVYDSPCRLKCAKAAQRFACGARSAAACAADCLAAAAAAPSVCAAGSRPVCAMNGKVLPSPCALQVAKLAKRWDCGARRDCPKDCLAAARPLPACPSTGTGVCCKDGRLYPNDCLAKKAKTTKRFDCGTRLDCKGDCAVAAAPGKHCGCRPDFAPVCAKSGAVYTNDCLLKCAKAVKRQACGKWGGQCAQKCRALKGKP